MRKNMVAYAERIVLLGILIGSCMQVTAQNSVAHEWVEVNLEAIRKDISRPTVHARNLWFTSMAMYDCWAAYDSIAETYFLGKSMGDYDCAYDGIPTPSDIDSARNEAISFAAYRVMRHRYSAPPSQVNTFLILDTTMAYLGYDPAFTSTDYSTGIPAALGNYVAEQLIAAGFQDGANEINNYSNQYYQSINEPLPIDSPHFVGNPQMDSLNRWQPIKLTLFCDQANNPFTTTPEFTSPEWGDVIPFSMDTEDVTLKSRDGNDWNIYHDPGGPPHIGLEGDLETDDYRWGFELVAKWSGQMDPADTTLWDISPASIGNLSIDDLPQDISEYPDFYDMENGGDASTGHLLNPKTGLPYSPQIVKRGDYARILAEYWADGPDSETPPGHWFSIYNEISQGPEFTWKWNGVDSLDHLEYDVKTYFTMGGAMHDAAVSSWSIKGYYDYPRPVSAIRAMAELGQSTDDMLPNYHPAGLGLDPGHIEFVQLGDTIFDGDTTRVAGIDDVNELKLYCWAGPLVEDTCISGFPPDYQTEVAGAAWKLAKDFWPYQRPTFVSPPFAGYISGHSTFSSAAAEIMTLTTGDAFFPGGMGEFECPQNNFLVFEEGPSTDITLQWATYRDASDQTSLSRIWGGIHPPCDDIPGRKIGYVIGHDAFALAEEYFNGGIPYIESIVLSDNVINDADIASTLTIDIAYSQKMDTQSPSIEFFGDLNAVLAFDQDQWLTDSTYQVSYTILDSNLDLEFVGLEVDSAFNAYGNRQAEFQLDSALFVETLNPVASLAVDNLSPSILFIDLTFDETMDTLITPQISFPVEDPIGTVMTLDVMASQWINTQQYQAKYDLLSGTELHDIDVAVGLATDSIGNIMLSLDSIDQFSIDDLAPSTLMITPSPSLIADLQVGTGTFTITVDYSEPMDTLIMPALSFPIEDPLISSLMMDSLTSIWESDSSFVFVYDVLDANENLSEIDLNVALAQDRFGHIQIELDSVDAFYLDTENPAVSVVSVSTPIIDNTLIGSEGFTISVEFSETMDESVLPLLAFPNEDPSIVLSLNTGASMWTSATTYDFIYDVGNAGQSLADIDVQVTAAVDSVGNPQLNYDAPDAFSIDIISSVEENDLLSSIELYPNPTDGLLMVVHPDGTIIDRVELFDIKGRSILSREIGSSNLELDLHDLPEGIYELRIDALGYTVVKRIIKN